MSVLCIIEILYMIKLLYSLTKVLNFHRVTIKLETQQLSKCMYLSPVVAPTAEDNSRNNFTSMTVQYRNLEYVNLSVGHQVGSTAGGRL